MLQKNDINSDQSLLATENVVVRGSIHQGDPIFSSETRGKQCTAMAAASIAMAALHSPKEWTRKTVDDILHAGDQLFRKSIKNRPKVNAAEENASYLTAEEIDTCCVLEQKNCTFVQEEIVYGHLYNDYSLENLPNLTNLITKFFSSKESKPIHGILTCNDLSFALIIDKDVTGVFDSHSRGPTGLAESNGMACFINVNNANDLLEILHTNIPVVAYNANAGHQYQFTSFTVHVEADRLCNDYSSIRSEEVNGQSDMKWQMNEQEKEKVQNENVANEEMDVDHTDIHEEEIGNVQYSQIFRSILSNECMKEDVRLSTCDEPIITASPQPFPEKTTRELSIAMTAASIAMSAIVAVSKWTTRIIEDIADVGNELFGQHFLGQGVFTVEKALASIQNTCIFIREKKCTFVQGESVKGNVYLNLDGDHPPNLSSTLQYLFHSHDSGILTCNNLSFALIFKEGVASIFNLHSAARSALAESSSTASLITVTNHEQLWEVIESNIAANDHGDNNDEYEFTCFDVVLEDNIKNLNNSLLDEIEGIENIKQNACDENILLNFSQFFNEFHKVFANHCESCNLIDIKLERIADRGLQKNLHFKCNNCGKTVVISSVPDNNENMNVNVLAVVGCHNIGIGFSQFEELCGSCNIRCMSYNTWRNYSQKTCSYIDEAAEKEMKEAAAEERRLAVLRNDVIHGIPFTMVEADGSYMKRSYQNSRYDSPAACVVIVGRYTKKVLQIKVKQKTCAACEIAAKKGILPKKHVCHRNHGVDESSTSMESSAMAELFSNSIKERNLIYKVLISDGDSSNYKAIVDANPYGEYGVEVKNILCSNHIKRNVSTSIKVFSKQKGYLGPIRKNIEASAPTFIQAITNIVNNLTQLNDDSATKIRKFKNNLRKLPYHVFGDHSLCNDNYYDCTGISAPNEKNLVPSLVDANLFDGIDSCLHRAYSNTESLLVNVTTNRAESFNALIAKSIGAKRINFAKREGYHARCHIAALSSNAGDTVSAICETAGKNIPTIAQNIQLKRARSNQLRNIRKENVDPQEKKMFKSYKTADKDYGLHATQADLSDFQLSAAIEQHYETLREWQNDRDGIQKRTADQSNCSEWRMKRKWLITASKMGKICKKRPETSCANFVCDILYPFVKNDDPALNHGLACEVLAKAVLKEKGYDVQPCGLFIDEEFPGIGASPDGLIGGDGIVEIKCPYTAKDIPTEDAVRNKKLAIAKAFSIINGEATLKEDHDYHYQIQGQLRVTGRSYCLFVIFTFKDMKLMKIARNDTFIDRMMIKLKQFYRDCLAPEIVDSRRKRRMPIREPPYVTEAQEARKRKMLSQEKKNTKVSCHIKLNKYSDKESNHVLDVMSACDEIHHNSQSISVLNEDIFNLTGASQISCLAENDETTSVNNMEK